MWDPENTSLYYQSLRDIAAARQSEVLVQKASLLESQGYMGQTEIAQAYQYFGIQADLQSQCSDQQILDLFRSRVPDLGKEEQERAKHAIAKIAQARRSDLLKNATSDSRSLFSLLTPDNIFSIDIKMARVLWKDSLLTNIEIETYDQALAFLGAEHTTDDSFIVTLAQLKAEGNTLNAELAHQAVQIIGKQRNSDLLIHGDRSAHANSAMTPHYAYTLLNIEDPSNIDDEMISASHQIAVSDAPARASEFNEALSVIAEDRNSSALRYQLSTLTGNAIHVGPVGDGVNNWNAQSLEEPRGLNNIGNTCYLNSLLQYLFTVKPVRDMVEHFDEYKQHLPENEHQFEKKVADIKVDRDGVIRTQACKALTSYLIHS